MIYADLMDREINIGDYVVFYCGIHIVTEKLARSMLRIKAINSDTCSSQDSEHLCIIDKENVLIWKIKHGY